MTCILEWRWSDELNWRYDSHIQDTFNNPQQLSDKKNANPAYVQNNATNVHQIWRIRKNNGSEA